MTAGLVGRVARALGSLLLGACAALTATNLPSGCGFCDCDAPWPIGGVPQGTFDVPLVLVPDLVASDEMTVTIGETEVVFKYDEGEGPVQVVYRFEEPNGPVRAPETSPR
jgi:hypothetical protein